MQRVLAMVMAVLIAGCAAPDAGSGAGSPPTTAGMPAPAATPTAAPPLVATANGEGQEPAVADLAEGQALVARATGPVEVFESPRHGAPWLVLEDTTLLGSPRVLLVLGGPDGDWVEVSLPTRPNGSTGWVRAEQLELQVVEQAITVDLTARTMAFTVRGSVLLSTEVAIGSDANPTPAGSFFVTDVVQVADESGPWGPWALGLSAFSDTITDFNGGEGIIGIHGTNRPDKIGQAVSLGCVRVRNEVISGLAPVVDLGIPVRIAG